MGLALDIHPGFQVLEGRLEVGYVPGSYSDGYNVWLANDGGGVKTAAVAGALNTFEKYGYMSVIDGMACISGGLGAGLIAASGNLHRSEDLYCNDFPNSGIVSIDRFLKGGPLFDLQLAGQIISGYCGKYPDYLYKIPVIAGLSTPGQETLSPTFETVSDQNLTDLVEQSMHLPWLAGAPNVGRAIDGGLSWLSTARLAGESAIAANLEAKAIVIGIGASPNHYCIPNQRAGGFARTFLGHYYGRDVAKSMYDFPYRQADHLNQELMKGKMLIDGRTVGVVMVRPNRKTFVGGVTTTNPRKLAQCFKAGQEGMLDAIEGRVDHTIQKQRDPLRQRVSEAVGLGLIAQYCKVVA